MLSLMMCTNVEDLRERAGWDGAAGHSRRRLLVNLQRMHLYICGCDIGF